MTYEPKRDARFHYLWDLLSFIESEQCVSCRFRKDPDEDGSHAEEFPMCYEVEGKAIAEQPVEELDDRGSNGVVCIKYRPGNPQDNHVDPQQLSLF